MGYKDKSPLHMLPYPNHAHLMIIARRHVNSQPNLNDLISESTTKYQYSQVTQYMYAHILMCGAPPSWRFTWHRQAQANISSSSLPNERRTSQILFIIFKFYYHPMFKFSYHLFTKLLHAKPYEIDTRLWR